MELESILGRSVWEWVPRCSSCQVGPCNPLSPASNDTKDNDPRTCRPSPAAAGPTPTPHSRGTQQGHTPLGDGSDPSLTQEDSSDPMGMLQMSRRTLRDCRKLARNASWDD